MIQGKLGQYLFGINTALLLFCAFHCVKKFPVIAAAILISFHQLMTPVFCIFRRQINSLYQLLISW